MNCLKCGAPVQSGAQSCSRCGATLAEMVAAAQSAPKVETCTTTLFFEKHVHHWIKSSIRVYFGAQVRGDVNQRTLVAQSPTFDVNEDAIYEYRIGHADGVALNKGQVVQIARDYAPEFDRNGRKVYDDFVAQLKRSGWTWEEQIDNWWQHRFTRTKR